jgi:gliding motility-associated-like protein
LPLDTSTQISPAHAYTHYGRYTVSLTAWDSIGCDTTLIKTNLIFVDSTKIGFSVDEKFSRCPPLVSVFSSYADRNDLKYLWNFGDGYTDTAANPTHIYFHPGIYTVKLTGTSKYGCTNTVIDSGLIVVQGPSGAFNINPNSGCVPVTVSFSGATSSNVETVICDLGNGTLYTDSLNFNYTYNAAGIFHPKFILTDHIGCSVPYSLDSIITHSRPMLIVKDTSICTGSSISVNLGSDQYLWKTPVAGCDTCLKELSYCDTCSNVILTPSDSTLYVVTATNGAGCSVTDSIRVNVAAMPILIPHDTIRLCRNSSVDIQAIQNAYAATWTPELYLNSYSAFQTTCTPMANVDYTVTAFNRLGCSVSEAIPVRVVNNIGVAVSGDTAVCAGSAVQLHVACTDTFLYGVVYTWQPAAGISNMHSQSPTVTAPSETEKYTVIATSGSCAADTATITVSINAPATVKLPGTITTTPLAEVDIAPVSGDLATYSWSAKDDLSCTTCAATTILPKESQLVYLEGTNQYGCNTKDSMFIHVLNCDPAGIFVPNTFTPNGDGLNDRLYVRSKTLAQLEYFRLYDRWGAVVFETKNMSEGWDGVINGRIAEQGVYVYQVNGKCENGYDVATSGTVTLVR